MNSWGQQDARPLFTQVGEIRSFPMSRGAGMTRAAAATMPTVTQEESRAFSRQAINSDYTDSALKTTSRPNLY